MENRKGGQEEGQEDEARGELHDRHEEESGKARRENVSGGAVSREDGENVSV